MNTLNLKKEKKMLEFIIGVGVGYVASDFITMGINWIKSFNKGD